MGHFKIGLQIEFDLRFKIRTIQPLRIDVLKLMQSQSNYRFESSRIILNCSFQIFRKVISKKVKLKSLSTPQMIHLESKWSSNSLIHETRKTFWFSITEKRFQQAQTFRIQLWSHGLKFNPGLHGRRRLSADRQPVHVSNVSWTNSNAVPRLSFEGGRMDRFFFTMDLPSHGRIQTTNH